MKLEKSCGAVVFNEKREVLVVTHRAGHTDFPKGHVEKGEAEEETAKREVKEETNIDIELIPKRYCVYYSPKTNVNKTVVFFPAKQVGGKIVPQEKEVSDARWIPINEVNSYLTFDSARNLLKQILLDNENL